LSGRLNAHPFLWGTCPAPLLGLDIGSSSIKLVEIHSRGHQKVLKHCDRAPLGSGWVVDGRIVNPHEVAAVIRGLIDKTGTKTRRVALGLPSSAVISRQVFIPRGLTEPEIEQQVEMEARQAMGLPLEELYLDFCEESALSNRPDKVAVQIIGTRRERINDLQALCDRSGLEPVVVEIQNASLSRAMVRVMRLAPPTPADAIFLQLKWSASTVSTQAFQYVKPIYWYSQSCAQPLQDKHRGALLKDIENGLQQFLQTATTGRVHGLYLAGGVALTEGICEWATQATHIPCDVLDPFVGLAVHPGLDRHTVHKEAPHYVRACGLALRTPA
jgi:type IV pilus assembly protein PilM